MVIDKCKGKKKWSIVSGQLSEYRYWVIGFRFIQLKSFSVR
jgi:hypothetical protein